MRLRGSRVKIRPMRRADVHKMAQWRRSIDPLYQPFDFPQRSRSEHDRWFTWRSQDASRRLYAVENEAGQVIGSLTLREIRGRTSARLGVTIGADFVSKGYGSEALRLFLDHYFDEMGFTRLILDVASTNLRAVRTYRALGFSQVGEHYRPASHKSYRVVQSDPRYRHLRANFRRQGPSTQVLFYDMVLTREEWYQYSQEEPEE